MSTLNAIIGYLLQTVVSLYLMAMLLRFVLQLVRADFYNPICQFLVKVTNPVLIPARRIVPGFGGVDVAALLLVLLLHMAALELLVLLKYHGLLPFITVLAGSVIGMVSLLVYIYFFALLAMIVVSWIAPQSNHPAIYLLHQITEPVMAPVRRVIPPIGGLDLSPIAIFILINMIRIALTDLSAAAGVYGLLPWLQ